jgi:hypothetical protein
MSKFCKDCVHFRRSIIGSAFGAEINGCAKGKRDEVTGMIAFAGVERVSNRCGESGRRWEFKPSLTHRLLSWFTGGEREHEQD